MNIVIFVSSRGSNMEAIINASKRKEININILAVICNNPNARAIEIAKLHNLNIIIIDHTKYKNREEYENIILDSLSNYNIDLICLAGYMRILGSKIINKYKNKIINIHPSLLPKYKGLNALKRAYENKDKEVGCTVHFVTNQLDSGKIIIQKKTAIDKSETYQELEKRTLIIEHKAYIESINIIANEAINKK